MANSKETYQSTHTGAEIDAGIDLLDKNNATEGQVLTANGTGGASWQNAAGGGGGTQLYRHGIYATIDSYYITFTMYSTVSEAFTIQSLEEYLSNIGTIYLSGIVQDEQGNVFPLISVDASVSINYISNNVSISLSLNGNEINDSVTPL